MAKKNGSTLDILIGASTDDAGIRESVRKGVEIANSELSKWETSSKKKNISIKALEGAAGSTNRGLFLGANKRKKSDLEFQAAGLDALESFVEDAIRASGQTETLYDTQGKIFSSVRIKRGDVADLFDAIDRVTGAVAYDTEAATRALEMIQSAFEDGTIKDILKKRYSSKTDDDIDSLCRSYIDLVGKIREGYKNASSMYGYIADISKDDTLLGRGAAANFVIDYSKHANGGRPSIGSQVEILRSLLYPGVNSGSELDAKYTGPDGAAYIQDAKEKLVGMAETVFTDVRYLGELNKTVSSLWSSMRAILGRTEADSIKSISSNLELSKLIESKGAEAESSAESIKTPRNSKTVPLTKELNDKYTWLSKSIVRLRMIFDTVGKIEAMVSSDNFDISDLDGVNIDAVKGVGKIGSSFEKSFKEILMADIRSELTKNGVKVKGSLSNADVSKLTDDYASVLSKTILDAFSHKSYNEVKSGLISSIGNNVGSVDKLVQLVSQTILGYAVKAKDGISSKTIEGLDSIFGKEDNGLFYRLESDGESKYRKTFSDYLYSFLNIKDLSKGVSRTSDVNMIDVYGNFASEMSEAYNVLGRFKNAPNGDKLAGIAKTIGGAVKFAQDFINIFGAGRFLGEDISSVENNISSINKMFLKVKDIFDTISYVGSERGLSKIVGQDKASEIIRSLSVVRTKSKYGKNGETFDPVKGEMVSVDGAKSGSEIPVWINMLRSMSGEAVNANNAIKNIPQSMYDLSAAVKMVKKSYRLMREEEKESITPDDVIKDIRLQYGVISRFRYMFDQRSKSGVDASIEDVAAVVRALKESDFIHDTKEEIDASRKALYDFEIVRQKAGRLGMSEEDKDAMIKRIPSLAYNMSDMSTSYAGRSNWSAIIGTYSTGSHMFERDYVPVEELLSTNEKLVKVRDMLVDSIESINGLPKLRLSDILNLDDRQKEEKGISGIDDILSMVSKIHESRGTVERELETINEMIVSGTDLEKLSEMRERKTSSSKSWDPNSIAVARKALYSHADVDSAKEEIAQISKMMEDLDEKIHAYYTAVYDMSDAKSIWNLARSNNPFDTTASGGERYMNMISDGSGGLKTDLSTSYEDFVGHIRAEIKIAKDNVSRSFSALAERLRSNNLNLNMPPELKYILSDSVEELFPEYYGKKTYNIVEARMYDSAHKDGPYSLSNKRDYLKRVIESLNSDIEELNEIRSEIITGVDPDGKWADNIVDVERLDSVSEEIRKKQAKIARYRRELNDVEKSIGSGETLITGGLKSEFEFSYLTKPTSDDVYFADFNANEYADRIRRLNKAIAEGGDEAYIEKLTLALEQNKAWLEELVNSGAVVMNDSGKYIKPVEETRELRVEDRLPVENMYERMYKYYSAVLKMFDDNTLNRIGVLKSEFYNKISSTMALYLSETKDGGSMNWSLVEGGMNSAIQYILASIEEVIHLTSSIPGMSDVSTLIKLEMDSMLDNIGGLRGYNGSNIQKLAGEAIKVDDYINDAASHIYDIVKMFNAISSITGEEAVKGMTLIKKSTNMKAPDWANIDMSKSGWSSEFDDYFKFINSLLLGQDGSVAKIEDVMSGIHSALSSVGININDVMSKGIFDEGGIRDRIMDALNNLDKSVPGKTKIDFLLDISKLVSKAGGDAQNAIISLVNGILSKTSDAANDGVGGIRKKLEEGMPVNVEDYFKLLNTDMANMGRITAITDASKAVSGIGDQDQLLSFAQDFVDGLSKKITSFGDFIKSISNVIDNGGNAANALIKEFDIKLSQDRTTRASVVSSVEAKLGKYFKDRASLVHQFEKDAGGGEKELESAIKIAEEKNSSMLVKSGFNAIRRYMSSMNATNVTGDNSPYYSNLLYSSYLNTQVGSEGGDISKMNVDDWKLAEDFAIRTSSAIDAMGESADRTTNAILVLRNKTTGALARISYSTETDVAGNKTNVDYMVPKSISISGGTEDYVSYQHKISLINSELIKLSSSLSDKSMSGNGLFSDIAGEARKASEELIKMMADVRNGKKTFEELESTYEEYKKILEDIGARSDLGTVISKSISELSSGLKTIKGSYENLDDDQQKRYIEAQTVMDSVLSDIGKLSNGEGPLAGKSQNDINTSILERLNLVRESLGIEKSEKDNLVEIVRLRNESVEAQTRQINESARMTAQTSRYYSLRSKMDKGISGWTAARTGSSSEAYKGIVSARSDLDRAFSTFSSSSKSARDVAIFNKAVADATEGFNKYRQRIISSGEATKSFGERTLAAVKKFGSWMSVTRLVMRSVMYFKQLIKAAVDIDKAMTELRIVTNETAGAYENFTNRVADAAKKVAASMSDMISSVTVYARLGYNLDESTQMATLTSMLQNVGAIETKDAQNAITAITKAFGVSVDDLEVVMDKLVTVGNNFPISVSEIAEGMNNAASALSTAGNSIDQSIALLTAANTTVQDISKASTGLRTLVARIRNTKTELDDLGESVTTAEYGKIVSSLTSNGVSLTDDNGNLKSTYDVLKEIAGVSKQLKETDPNKYAALAETLAGTRQQNIFYSLVENFDEASKAMDAMSKSEGALSDSNDEYLTSTAAHVAQFKAAVSELAQDLFPKEFLNNIVDAGSKLINILDRLSKDSFPALKWSARIAGVALATSLSSNIFKKIRAITESIDNLGGMLSSMPKKFLAGGRYILDRGIPGSLRSITGSSALNSVSDVNDESIKNSTDTRVKFVAGKLTAKIDEEKITAGNAAVTIDEEKAVAGNAAAEADEKKAIAGKGAAEADEKKAIAGKGAAEADEEKSTAGMLSSEAIEGETVAEEASIVADEMKIGSTDGVTEANVGEKISAELLEEENINLARTEQMLSNHNIERAGTSTAVTDANLSQAESEEALAGAAAASKMMMASMIIIVIGLSLAIKAISDRINRSRDAFKKYSESLDDTKDKLSDASDRLKEIKDRVEEINGMSHISIIEEDELNNLEIEKNFLEQTVELLERKRALEAEEKNKSLGEMYEGRGTKGSDRKLTISQDATGLYHDESGKKYNLDEDYFKELKKSGLSDASIGLINAATLNPDFGIDESSGAFAHVTLSQKDYTNAVVANYRYAEKRLKDYINNQVSNASNMTEEENARYNLLKSIRDSAYSDIVNLYKTIKDDYFDQYEGADNPYRSILDTIYKSINGFSSYYKSKLQSTSEFSRLMSKANEGTITVDDVKAETVAVNGANVQASRFAELMKEAGWSAEDVLGIILSMVDAEEAAADNAKTFADNISGVKESIDGLSLLKDIMSGSDEDGWTVDLSKIIGNDDFSKAFSGLDGYNDFIKTVSSFPSDARKVGDAVSALASEFLSSSIALEDLDDENKLAIINLLRYVGVANAAEIVERELSIRKIEEALSSEGLANAQYREYSSHLENTNATEEEINALFRLMKAKHAAGAPVNTTEDVDAIIAVANAAGIASDELKDAKQLIDSGDIDGANRLIKDFFNKTDSVTLDISMSDNAKKTVDDIYNLFSKTNIDVGKEAEVYGDSLRDAVKVYREAIAEGIDLSRTKYGNVDQSIRGVINWDESTLGKYSDAISSWGYDPEDLIGSQSTELGAYGEFGSQNIKVAFTPILNTDGGPVLLERDTVEDYIEKVVEMATDESGAIDIEKLLRIDSEGIGTSIRNIIAGVGESAEEISKSMHYTGNYGAIADGVRRIADAYGIAAEKAGNYEQIVSRINTSWKAGFNNDVIDNLQKLDDIYQDIKNGEDFDYDRLFGEDFKSGFGSLSSYDDFINTVANNTRDIDACAEAFNKLSDELIFNSGYLENLTEANRNYAIEALKQKGISNAEAIVDRELAVQKRELAMASGEYANATAEEIIAAMGLVDATDVEFAALARLLQEKIMTNAATLDTSGDIDNLIDLCNAAGATINVLNNLRAAKALLEKAQTVTANTVPNTAYIDMIPGISSGEKNSMKADMAARYKQELIDQAQLYMSTALKQFNSSNYSGGSASNVGSSYSGSPYSGSSGSGSGSGSGDSETWFERALKDHKHMVEMDKETQAEYLTWLNDAYQKAYKEGIITLDDYYSYAEEVFNGLRELVKDSIDDINHEVSMRQNYETENAKIIELYREMIRKVEAELKSAREYGLSDNDEYVQELQDMWWDYTNSIKDLEEDVTESAKDALDDLVEYRMEMLKKDVEDQKEALSDKLDALKDFYDEQKKMLQDSYNEEKYLDEQSEKRKSVTDIQNQINQLSKDNSAWAQKRIVELTKDLEDAQKELDEFEKSHSLEMATDAIDSAYDATEKMINKQIEALEDSIDDPERLYNKALADIKANTGGLYEEMLEYNRRNGTGNDEDIKDQYEKDYQALLSYLNTFGSNYKDVVLQNSTGYKPNAGISNGWNSEVISGYNPANKVNQSSTSGSGSSGSSSSTTAAGSKSNPYGTVSKLTYLLKQGSTGTGVKALQYALNQLGYNAGSVDGIFGANTYNAVYKFQRDAGILADGIVGANTRAIFAKKGYASGTDSATAGIHRVDEIGAEYLFTSGNGNKYRVFSGGEKVLNAKATNFLYDFANSGGSIIGSIIDRVKDAFGFGAIKSGGTIAQVTMGDIIINGNASEHTVSEIRRAQRDNVNYMLKQFSKLKA